MKKKLFSILLSLAMVVTMIPMMTGVAFATGGAGTPDNPWLIGTTGHESDVKAWLTENTPATDPETYTLTISGTGKMKDFSYNATPWCDNVEYITSATVSNGITNIGDYAFFDLELMAFEIPKSVTSIGENAFGSCSSLKSINISSSVESIGDRAFESCIALTDVTIPSSVETIGIRAFSSCYDLTNVTIKRNTPPTLGDNAFFDCPNGLKIYVPVASVDAYKDAWSAYSDKIVGVHDLTVTKNGGEEATLGTDYSWDADYPQKLIILKDGLTVSGTTTNEYILVNYGVTNLTIKDLSISLNRGTCINFDYDFENPDARIENATLTLVGENTLTMQDGTTMFLLSAKVNTIEGQGNLVVSACSDPDPWNSGTSIYSDGVLVFNQVGTVKVSAKNGIFSSGKILFNNNIGKVVARANNDGDGAVHGLEGIEVGNKLSIKGSTFFDAYEPSIISEIEIKDGCAYIGDNVAKSVLIQSTYDVTVASDIKNGTVAVDKGKAAKDETVTVITTPATDYELDTLTVTTSGGEAVTVTNNQFTMPADSVTVKATFKAKSTPTPAPTPDNTDKGVKTGDSSDIFFYGFATLLALLGAGFVYGLRRKEEK